MMCRVRVRRWLGCAELVVGLVGVWWCLGVGWGRVRDVLWVGGGGVGVVLGFALLTPGWVGWVGLGWVGGGSNIAR